MSQTRNTLNSLSDKSFKELLREKYTVSEVSVPSVFSLGAGLHIHFTSEMIVQKSDVTADQIPFDSFYKRLEEEQRQERELQRKLKRQQERLKMTPEVRGAFERFDQYGTNELSLSSSLQQLKREYRRIARQVHPDSKIRSEDKLKAHKEFLALHEAYLMIQEQLLPNLKR